MLTLNVENYNNCLERVVQWNGVIDNKDRELQREMVLEEVDEAIEAIGEQSSREIMLELADVFVTVGYLNYLHTESYVNEFVIQDDVDPIYLLNGIRASTKTRNVPSHTDIQKLFYWAASQYGEEQMYDALLSVLDSNESKFVPDHLWDSLAEIDDANIKYASKGHKNIIGMKRTFMGSTVWVLRADRGEGKVLKPSTFKKP